LQFLAAQQNQILKKVIPSKARTINLNKKKNEEGENTFIIDDSTDEGVFKGYTFLDREVIPTLTNDDFCGREKAKDPVEKMLTKATKPKAVKREV